MAALYWQLTVSENGSPNYVALADLAFLDAAGVDVTTGGSAYASSTFSGFDPAAAFDKDPATRWASEMPAPQSLWYRFPVAVEVAAARITWDANAVYLPRRAQSVSLSFSSDGNRWQLAGFGRLTAGSIAAAQTATFAFDPVRVVALDRIQRVLTEAYAGPYGHSRLAPPIEHAGDYKTGLQGKGIGTISGFTEVKGAPANAPLRARVRLLRERDGLVYREMWSDPVTGAYRFDNVDELEVYTVLTYHPARANRAVVADGLVPEVLQ